ncbi:MAG: hypothetical protein RIS29_1211 [Bacteroidota bacterium]|jgi:hypothetical protein
MNNISVNTQLTQQQYINVLYLLNYRRFAAYTSHMVGLMFMLSSVALFATTGETMFSTFIIGGLVFLLNPALVYLNGVKSFKLPNNRVTEPLTFTFTPEQFSIKGETFVTEMTWNKLYKVVETKNWLLIYQNKGMANVLPKSAISAELPEIRRIIGLTGIKYKH